MPSATLRSRPRRRRRRARGGPEAVGAGAGVNCLLLATLCLCLCAGVEALLVRPPRLAGQRQGLFGGRVALARQRGLASPLTMAAAAADGGGGGMEGEGSSSSSSKSNAKASPGRGFGDAVKRGSGDGSGTETAVEAGNGGGGGGGKAGRPRRGRPNSFSSLGQAVRHRGKFGHGAPFELGLLDMSTKLMERHEAVKERYAGARPVQPGGGRQRGAKKAAAFHALSSYSLHFLKLLEEELLYEEAEVMQRLWHWTRGRLQEEGLAVFGVVARPRGRLFKEHILRFTLPARKGSGGGGGGKGGGKGKYSGAKGGKYSGGGGGGPPTRAPPLHFHRLGPGDIISITPDRQNPLGSSEVIEGLVLERGPFFIDVVVKEIPPGVVYKRGDPTGGERFRLDLYLNRISFQRMVAAVHQVAGLETGFTVSPELRDILVKSFADRFDVVFPSAPQHQHASHHPSSLVAMSPYTGAAAAKRGDPRRVTASRERCRSAEEEAEAAEQARRKRAKAQRKAAGGGGRGDGGGTSSWEAMASAVPKTFYGRKEADKAVSEEVARFSLNESQEAALRMALARKLSLIQGPPGTGKTRTACHLINIAVRLQRRRADGKVLAVAFSNVAADNLLEGCLRLGLNAVRVGRAATVRPELRNHTLDALLANHESVATFKKKLEGARQAGSAATEIQAAKRDLEDAELLAAVSILGNADVVVSTCVGAANEAIVNAAAVTVSAGPGKGNSPLRAIKFPTVIVDEASQATEPATLVPLTQGCEQLVLVGDHYQLPPTIKSFRAQQQGLGISLFTRLALAGIRPSLLTVQYRMHPLIAQFPSRRFYGGLLQSHPANKHRPRPEGFPWPNPQLPVAFVAVGGDEDGSGGGSMGPFFEQRTSGNQTSYLNRKEGEVLVDVLNGVLRRGHVQCKDVGIVTPYSAQVKHVTELAQTRLRPFNAGDLEIQSVDAYQGREKELILISAVRSNRQGKVGFLGDWRRLNVAITRAKRGIVVVGDPRTLKNDPHWGAYLRWCLKRECVMPLAELRRLLQNQVAAAKPAPAPSAAGGEGAEGEAHAVECEVVV